LRGFNWGAFLLAPIWGLGNAVLPAIVIGLAGWTVPWLTRTSAPWAGFAVWLGAILFVGYKANEWAWRSRKWASVEQFRRIQQAWLLWAIIASAIVMIVYYFFFRPPQT
jgi:serine/threonine-protein kinase